MLSIGSDETGISANPLLLSWVTTETDRSTRQGEMF